MENSKALKRNLFFQCEAFLNVRLETVKHTIDQIQEALNSETKSSAGDKHETGRAMLQLEREKAGNQLAEIEKTKQILSKINIESTSKTIGLGSVVFTTQANYFIAISAGELIVEKQKFYAISASTPIGQLLLGKKVNDEIVFRNQHFKITRML
ncbi:3-oxoacyl-ACP synthase [Flavobacteriaceae bacterium SZ-1-7]|uniref:3-oxoacyl-ACP synthase n=1 Tax=Tamlana sedimenti TaxID=3134126 RepID=UPI0031271042